MLRIDLLPRSIAQGRRNVRLLMFSGVAIAVAAVVMFLWLQQVKTNIAQTEEEYNEAHTKAEAVRAIDSEASAKQTELDPIAGKIKFVEKADGSGEVYFDRFWKINEYIYVQAPMSSFSISPPASVSFTVQVSDTTEAGRFVLNLIQCPHITGIQISGMPPGESVEPERAGSATAPTIAREEVITFNVTATLTDPIETPQPPAVGGGAGAGAPGGGMPGGPEGMMPPMGGPGMDGGGGAPPPPGA